MFSPLLGPLAIGQFLVIFGPLRPLRAPSRHTCPLGRCRAAATEAPRNSSCLPALAHTVRLALASRAGMRTRPLRDAAVADLRVAEGPPGDLAGALAVARTEASAPLLPACFGSIRTAQKGLRWESWTETRSIAEPAAWQGVWSKSRARGADRAPPP